MKILFSGHHNPHFFTITEYLEKAIRLLGHELFVFEDRQHSIPGRLRKYLPFLNQIDLKIINKKMISIAEKTKPDIAIVTGGHRISSAMINQVKDEGIICILWTIDAPLYFQPIMDVAPFYDQIFCQGTEAIELLDKAGIRGAQWLPMACDPDYHHPVECTSEEKKKYGSDIVFVGSYYPERAALFEKMTDLDLTIWGPGWESLPQSSPLKRKIRGKYTTPDEWLKIYSVSKIVLATHYQDPQNRFPVYQASPRVFEAMACGCFVISDRQRDVFSLFEDGKHLVGFDNPNDLIEKIKYYLAHPEEREAIARRGREEVLKNHTYADRIKKLISLVTKPSCPVGRYEA
jgi:spore maturation protein CgeB